MPSRFWCDGRAIIILRIRINPSSILDMKHIISITTRIDWYINIRPAEYLELAIPKESCIINSMRKNIFKFISVPVLVLLLIFCAAGCNSRTQKINPVSMKAGTDVSSQPASAGTDIRFNGNAITVNGTGAASRGTSLTISRGGIYNLSGSLNSGQVLIEAPSNETVELFLNGVDIRASGTAAIYSTGGAGVVITLMEGSGNILTDAPPAGNRIEKPDAVIYCEGALSFIGGGSLELNARRKNGIASLTDLDIRSGTFALDTQNHSIYGKNSVIIEAGNFNIRSGNDGIQADAKEAGLGRIEIKGGVFDITAARDAIQAENDLVISGGTFAVKTGGGSGVVPGDDSCKGLKAGGDLIIRNGTFNLDCSDDTVHSNNNIAISGGTLVLATGDDAVHADSHVDISGGTITITKSVEGIEGNTISISGGTISLVSSDDGINAAGDDPNRWLRISGGIIVVDAEGDGIDINGDGEITGGEIYVHGPVGRGDGAIDFDGVFNINGGKLVAAGSDGMAQAFSRTSKQASLMIYYSSTVRAGTSVEVSGPSGEKLISFVPKKDCRNIVFSSPELRSGSSYTIRAGGTTTRVTLSGPVTIITDTGAPTSAGWRRM